MYEGNQMVERVARAIFRNGIGELVWDSGSDEQHEACFRQARAAIDAMRVPTEAMKSAPHEAELDIYWGYRAEGPGGPEDVWRVMIDAALTPPPSGEM
jgi:hypothetical protein